MLTLPEYNLLIKAAKLKSVDLDYRIHMQAYLNRAVKAERSVGKGKTRPVYTSFKKFFDYENALEKILNAKEVRSRFAGIGKFLKKGG